MTRTSGAVRTEQNPRFSSSPYEPALPPVTDVSTINLLDQQLYIAGDPHAAWRLLRQTAPVWWHEHPSAGTEDKGFWVLTRYDDITRVYKDTEVFSSRSGPFLDLRMDQTPTRILSSIDGPEHRTSRGIVTKFFTPQAINVWTEGIRRTVTRLMDSIDGRDQADFATDIADKLPIAVTCDLLGISLVEAQTLKDLLFEMGSDVSNGLETYNAATLSFFSSLAERRRREGARETILDVVANAAADGKPVSGEDIDQLLWILFFGGIDSTVHAATGGMLALFHHPAQMDLLREDPGLANIACDEILRWTSTSHANKRKVLQDIEISGQKIRKDDFVSVWSPSANRDEIAFEDPYRFDIQRVITRTRPIATFGGGGPHQCIGQFFARLELRILFEELLRRFPKIQQAGPAVRHEHFTMLLSPIVSLPVAPRG